MRDLILNLTITLDGFTEGKNREVDWISFDEKLGEDLLQFADEIDTVIYGRKSFELYGNYAPPIEEGEYFYRFYQKINTMKKYVFSRSAGFEPRGAELMTTDYQVALRTLKSQKGKNIWVFGGGNLASSLLNDGLLDELRIGINPVLLGVGNPLFQEIKSKKTLRLTTSKVYPCGIVGVEYRVLN